MLTPATLTAVRARLNDARVALQSEPLDEQAVRASLADASELLAEVDRLRNREHRLLGSIKYLIGLCSIRGLGRHQSPEDLRAHLHLLHLDGLYAD